MICCKLMCPYEVRPVHTSCISDIRLLIALIRYDLSHSACQMVIPSNLLSSIFVMFLACSYVIMGNGVEKNGTELNFHCVL